MTANGGSHWDDAITASSLDDLRRRLYWPDATAEDRERYRLALEAAGRQPEDAPVAQPRRPRRNRRPLLLSAAVAAVVALAIVLSRAIAGSPPQAPTPVDVDAGTRVQFIRSLTHSGAAGLAGYLVTYQFARRSALVIERWGTGPGNMALQPGEPTVRRRYATVYLVLDRSEHAHWTAYALRPTTDNEDPLVAVAERAGQQEGGVPAYATFSYVPTRPPLRLRIEVPEGVRWGAAVILTG